MANSNLAKNMVRPGTLLRVYVREQTPQQPATAWALLTQDGSLLSEGVSAPDQWPEAENCEAIFSAPQAIWLGATLPDNLPRNSRTQLLANAIEERVIDEPDQLHLTITGNKQGSTRVIAIASERLREVTAWFSAMRRPLVHAYSELQTSPIAEDGNWHLTLSQDVAILRRHPADGVALDLGHDHSPPPLLEAMVRAGCNGERKPPVLIVHVPGTNDPVTLKRDAWQSALDVQVLTGTRYSWHSINAATSNLLHGKFAPSHDSRKWLDPLRPALWFAAAILLLGFLVDAGSVAWLRYQLELTNQQIAQKFTDTFPGIPLLAPIAQTRQQLDRLSSPAGLLRNDDALSLLAAFAQAAGNNASETVQSLHYQDGTLEIGLSPKSATKAEVTRQQLQSKGLDATIRHADGNSGGTATDTLIVRPEMKR